MLYHKIYLAFLVGDASEPMITTSASVAMAGKMIVATNKQASVTDGQLGSVCGPTLLYACCTLLIGDNPNAPCCCGIAKPA